MTDKAYTDAPASFRTSVDLRSRAGGGARPTDKIVSLSPRNADDPPPPGAERAAPAPTSDWSSAIELIQEASEAIRISEARAEELEDQLDRLAEQASEEVSRLTAELAASDQRLATNEQRLLAAEAHAHEAEAWLVRLHDAIQSAFAPLHRRPKAGQIADRPSEAPLD